MRNSHEELRLGFIQPYPLPHNLRIHLHLQNHHKPIRKRSRNSTQPPCIVRIVRPTGIQTNDQDRMRYGDSPGSVLLDRDRDECRRVWFVPKRPSAESFAESCRKRVHNFDHARGKDLRERPRVGVGGDRALGVVESGWFEAVLVGDGRTLSIAILEQSDRIEGVLD